DTIASAGVPVHFDQEIGLTKQFEHAQVFDAGEWFYLPLNLKRRTLELREVSAEQFDGVLTLHPGHGLLHIVLDDLREIECDSRKGLELVFDLPDDPRFVKTGGPLLARLEVHEKLRVEEDRGVGPVIRADQLGGRGFEGQIGAGYAVAIVV